MWRWMASQWALGDIFYSYGQSDPMGQIIVWALVLASTGVWTVMLTKAQRLSAARRIGEAFLRAYRRSPNPTRVPPEQTRSREGASPLLGIYGAVMDAVRRFALREGDGLERLTRPELQELRSIAERKVADELLTLEDGMGMLATATTTAPFIGLFGTVYGIMLAFKGMAEQGNAALSAVAPGVSGALVTTVVALMVAIPTAVGYNVLSERIKRLAVQTENFAEELLSDVERFFGNSDGNADEN